LIQANFKLLTNTAKLPIYGNDDDSNAGIDIFSDQDITIPAKQSRLVQTGIAWSPRFITTNWWNLLSYLVALYKRKYKNIEMHLRSRSGLSVKHNLEVGAGTIDSGYRNQIGIHLYNHGFEAYRIKKGERIAQGVISEIPKVKIKQVEYLDINTKRGLDGFGSTGK